VDEVLPSVDGGTAYVVLDREQHRRAVVNPPGEQVRIQKKDRLGSPEVVCWAAENFAGVEVESVGPGGHQIPEDQPAAMGAAVASWLRRHALVTEAAARR
jgi:haloalkane dehalogenase